uniref:Uncharacterized protein MANES_11G033500 n=1 Tax=Rhizophora mucronata TaxID=61149 RepID=A0A2P2MWV4_RHIMU
MNVVLLTVILQGEQALGMR